MLLEQDKAFFWERIEDASKSMLQDGGCCRERTEDAAGRGQGMLLREDRAFCREGQRMLQGEDRGCCWERTGDASERGQSILQGGTEDATGRGQICY
jgi:hypothetical protein